MADVKARPVPGTDGAISVFWSPDSRSLAFFAGGKLKRIELPGGAAGRRSATTSLTHGTWGAGAASS